MVNRYDENEINSIYDIINGIYFQSRHNILERDLNNLFIKMTKEHTRLTHTELLNLIKFLTKGLSRSHLGYNKKSNIMNIITKTYLLDEKMVALVIKAVPKSSDFTWIDNLNKLGFVMTTKQTDDLITKGYSKGIDLLLKQDQASVTDFNNMCKARPFKLNDLTNFLDKFKIIPTIDNYKLILDDNYFKIHENNEFGGKNILYLDEVMISLLTRGMVMTNDLLTTICNTFSITNELNIVMYEYVILFLQNSSIKSTKELTNIIKDHNFEIIKLKNLNVLLKFANTYKLEKDNDIFNHISKTCYYHSNNYHTSPIYSSYLVSSFNEYEKIIDILYGECGYEPTESIIEGSCLKGDELLFDKTLNKLNTVTQLCIINACKSSHTNILTKLVSMKIIPDINCVDALSNCNSTILTFLIDNGLYVNHDVIKLSLSKQIIINDLDKFGIEYNLELYKICHELQIFPKLYIDKFDQNDQIHNKLRSDLCSNKNQNEIIEHIKKDKFADDMMYDDAVKLNKEQVVNYLETEWKMTPNIKTIAFISDINTRMKYIERLKETKLIHESLYNTKNFINQFINIEKINNNLIEDNIHNYESEQILPIIITKDVLKKKIVKGKKK